MKAVIKITVLLVLSVLVSAVFAGGGMADNCKGSQCANISYLFVQSANTATIKLVNKETNEYSFKLNGPDKHVVYFSDRPNRVVGVISLEKFLKLWNQGQDSFASDTPNVSLTGVKVHWLVEKKNANYVFSLSNPSLDSKTGAISYSAKLISPAADVDTSKPVVIHNVSLFFDNLSHVCLSCG